MFLPVSLSGPLFVPVGARLSGFFSAIEEQSMSEVELTTAQRLGRFRKELIEEGISVHVADDLVRIAAREELDGGFIVKAVSA